MASWKKRGLSPVIATVLLISLALVLAVIVFLWARNFIGESIEKQEQKIELVCEKVQFTAEAVRDGLNEKINIYIKNNGNVPIYSFEIRVSKIIGETKKVETPSKSVYSGETTEINIDDEKNEIKQGAKLTIVPILLGEAKDYKKAFVCEKNFGVEATVK